MKMIHALMLSCLLFIQCSAYALTVPFKDVSVSPYGALKASYDFGAHAVIYCFGSNAQGSSIMSWRYKTETKAATMPTRIKMSLAYPGEPADPTGDLMIANTQRLNLKVSCVFEG